MSLNSRIKELEKQVISLTNKVFDLSRNTESKTKIPYSIEGEGKDPGLTRPVDIRTGKCLLLSNPVIWNDAEIDGVFGTQPNIPKVGYNKHSHSRYSGGALIKGVIEVVEYDWGTIINKHSQEFLDPEAEYPKIIKTNKTNGETVDKIGLLDLVFNPDTQTWGCPAYEIDVQRCYLVMRDENGQILIDSKVNQMKSPLYNSDTTKTSVAWDENGNCWRLYAAYAPDGSQI